jgi:hypothetical protein
MIDRKQGIKKGPSGACLSAHGWLTPDGYTILPMRVPTTIRAIEFFMTGSVNGKPIVRQRANVEKSPPVAVPQDETDLSHATTY